jgi:hypothetical protein
MSGAVEPAPRWPFTDERVAHRRARSLLLPTLPGHDDALWDTLSELTELRPGEWTLIGGQMVYLHAIEHAATPPRVSTDLDVLVNARIATGGVAGFVAAIELRGFGLEGTSPGGLAHRYRRDGVSIDILAPKGLGPRTNLTTTSPGRTLEVPGGTQALTRTESLSIHTTTATGQVPRPSLLGAIIAKAEAVDVDDAPDAQRLDLAFLLSLVEEPLDLASRMTPKDRRRLRARTELTDAERPTWRGLPPAQRDRARAPFALLIR